MKHLLPFWLLLVFWQLPARAQGPTVDLTFTPGEVYAPADVRDAFVQNDGKLVLSGTFTQAGGLAAPGIARLLAGGTVPDPVFQANVAGLQGYLSRAFSLPANETLLTGSDLGLGTVSNRQLLRLNADGTPNLAFASVTLSNTVGLPTTIEAVVAQPDGKLIITGSFANVNGQPAANITRLNSDGTPDASFQVGAGLSGTGRALALLPGGNILVAGTFATVQGQARAGVAQLLPSGALDAAFVPATPSGYTARGLTVQPDGNLLLLALNRSGALALSRLLPTGAVDATFQPGTGFNRLASSFRVQASPVVQPDGKILVATATGTFNGTLVGGLVRLLPGGSLDPSFDNMGAVRPRDRTELVGALALLPTGQVLAGGVSLRAGVPGSPPQPLVLLSATGVADPTFAPRLLRPGAVRDVARQPDGKLIIGGEFTELNGQPAAYLARLSTTGTLDASFGAGTDGPVRSVALQPDGKVLVAGAFDYLAGSPRVVLGRVLPTGAIDVGFAPTSSPLSVAIQGAYARAWLQPDGDVLLGGQFNLRGATATTQAFARVLGTTGQRDNTFVPADSLNAPTDVLTQVGGRIVVAGSATFNGQNVAAWRLLPTGALDPAFALQNPLTGTNYPSGLALTQDGTGRLYLGQLYNQGPNYFANIVRTDANGLPDPSFQTGFTLADFYYFNSLLVQPNGRLLVGGLFDFSPPSSLQGSVRLLDTGTFDPSYSPTLGPIGTPTSYTEGNVNRFLIQPDGALIAVGDFRVVNGLPISGIVRLLDPNVLAMSSNRTAASLDAWPVPARGYLNLRLDAAARPQQVQLLDMLGKAVLTQPVTNPYMVVNTSTLPAGIYLLRVNYTTGSATRRVVLE